GGGGRGRGRGGGGGGGGGGGWGGGGGGRGGVGGGGGGRGARGGRGRGRQAGLEPDRDRARRRPRPRQGRRADRQDGAAPTLRLRERPAHAVDRCERQPGSLGVALRAAEAGAVGEGATRVVLPVPQQDRHGEAGEERREADDDGQALRRPSQPRADAQAAAQAVRQQGAKGRGCPQGAGTCARRLVPGAQRLPRRLVGEH